ncbi:MAG: DJ-1/PfpI family protein [Myxococcota bacterium]|jgi:4-methyl-5(b-hydroxyethyl)-thiazole monophosphate biosynthesis|nr:DJ-1/PfpI family protein [Myxococcota bacterium]
MMPKVLVILANGFEEIETACIVDILRRAGAELCLAGLDGTEPCVGSRQMRVLPDAALDQLEGEWALIVLPGGLGGTERMLQHEKLHRLLQTQAASKRLLAAVCAAPLVLDKAGVLPARFTCHPSVRTRLERDALEATVVDEGGVVTSRSAGTAMDFALHLVERLFGEQKRRAIEAALAR